MPFRFRVELAVLIPSINSGQSKRGRTLQNRPQEPDEPDNERQPIGGLTISRSCEAKTLMTAKHTVTLKELHEKTGKIVRGAAQFPVRVTDRGKLVAVITHPEDLPAQGRVRRILPDYARFLKKSSSLDVLDDLDAVRER